MERIGLIAAVSTYQRPSAKWARLQPGSRGEIVELGAILGFKDRLLRCSRGEHLRLPEYGAYVRLPTRSGRRGGVLQVPPARGAARDAREAVHAPLLGPLRGERAADASSLSFASAGYQPAEKREPEAASGYLAAVSVN